MNISNYIRENAKKFPDKQAVVQHTDRDSLGNYSYISYSFKELDERINRLANGFKDQGIKQQTKVLLFVRPCLDLSALTFALFRIGAVPILIDPGMGRKNLLRSIEHVKPEVLIAVPEVHLIRQIFRKPFRTIKHFITTGKLSFGKTSSLNKITKGQSAHCDIVDCSPDEMAAILFTSGGTGIPKGVVYTHKVFDTQTKMLQQIFSLTEDDIDLPGFPLFSLFTMSMGMSSWIPDMDPTKPAKADPERLVENIVDSKATFVAGSPAIWERVGNYCMDHNITLPTVKYLVMFGAPVSNQIHKIFKEVLPNGTTYTPYGATESLPVANISGKYVLSSTCEDTEAGLGTCVGKAVAGCQIKIIKTSDDVENTLQEIPQGEIGEILVSGDMVTSSYYHMEVKTKEAKIYSDGKLWHRMGDLGYLDDEGKLWFCGRKTHRVDLQKEHTLYSVQCEAIYNQHQSVKRTALVGLQSKDHIEAAIIVERDDHRTELSQDELEVFQDELQQLGGRYQHTKNISKFYLYDHFPVDVRHNIKIDRLKLRDWAQKL